MTTNFFSSPSFAAVFGSGIRDPRSGMGKNQDLGAGINIPDPQHCIESESRYFYEFGSGSSLLMNTDTIRIQIKHCNEKICKNFFVGKFFGCKNVICLLKPLQRTFRLFSLLMQFLKFAFSGANFGLPGSGSANPIQKGIH
jgi:hypothetical protein